MTKMDKASQNKYVKNALFHIISVCLLNEVHKLTQKKILLLGPKMIMINADRQIGKTDKNADISFQVHNM